MLITKKSMFTGKINALDIPVTPQEYANYINNKRNLMIQEAFPNLSEPLRVFLLTGVTPDEWNNVFGQPDTTTTHENMSDDNALFFSYILKSLSFDDNDALDFVDDNDALDFEF